MSYFVTFDNITRLEQSRMLILSQTIKDFPENVLVKEITKEQFESPTFYFIEQDNSIIDIGRPTMDFAQYDSTAKMWVKDKLSLERSIINKRNKSLFETDWTDTVSAQTRLGDTLYNQWQDYRQALRDIPQQEGFPENIIWPSKPER